jgi:hypothetical protein
LCCSMHDSIHPLVHQWGQSSIGPSVGSIIHWSISGVTSTPPTWSIVLLSTASCLMHCTGHGIPCYGRKPA